MSRGAILCRLQRFSVPHPAPQGGIEDNQPQAAGGFIEMPPLRRPPRGGGKDFI